MSESLSSMDPNDDELKQALAAFGDNAMELLLDDDSLGGGLIEEDQEAAAAIANFEAACEEYESPDIQEIGIDEDDSSLIRYTKELANAIYCGHSMPHQQNRGTSGKSTTDRSIVFTVGHQPFALELASVREVVRHPTVTALPRTPAWLLGVTNLREQIISVIDLRFLLGITAPTSAFPEKTIVVHSDVSNQNTSIVADRILGIRNLRDQQHDLSNLSAEVRSIATAVASFDAGQTVLIDNNKLFEAAKLTPVSNQANQHLSI